MCWAAVDHSWCLPPHSTTGKPAPAHPTLTHPQGCVELMIGAHVHTKDDVGGTEQMYVEDGGPEQCEDLTVASDAAEGIRDMGPQVNVPQVDGWLAPHLYRFTAPDHEMVAAALGNGPSDELLAEFRNIPVTRKHMTTLRSGKWLTDEVINAFFALLSIWDDDGLKRCYFASTLFYARLTNGGRGYFFHNIQRWTKGRDIATCELIVVPLHVGGNHWALAVINRKEGSLLYYDSLGGYDIRVLDNLVCWLKDVDGNPNGTVFRYKSCSTPAQSNGWDCGVFMTFYVYYLVAGVDPDFTQLHCRRLRRWLALKLLKS